MKCSWIVVIGLLGMLTLQGCKSFTEHKLARMIWQRRFQSYEPCDYFEDGRLLRTPPLDTVTRDADIRGVAITLGRYEGKYVEKIPISVTKGLLRRGQSHYDNYCAPCHGARGDGNSRVALSMDLRKPPPIAGPIAAGLPPGRVYQVITGGYGLMRSYVEDLPSADERWSVVAYLEALGLTHAMPLDALPSDAQQAARRLSP